MRKATLRRTTGETDISISLTIDGTGRFEGTSGIGFFDHMLHLLARHSGMGEWIGRVEERILPIAIACDCGDGD